MSNYEVKLTPEFRDRTTEGGLDSSVLNGKSIQRTFCMTQVVNGKNRKMVSNIPDGSEFNDTTFEKSDGTGNFEVALTFTADQILGAAISYDQNGFVGVGAVLVITADQASTLNSYGYPSLIFSAVWADGSENTSAYLYVFTGSGDYFTDIAVIAPLNESLQPYCGDPTTWNMPVNAIEFVYGDNNAPGFMERTPDVHVIHELFKQVAAQQEVDFEGKTPQEKAAAIRAMLENLADDHPLVANMRKNNVKL
jgi:hypothetical protein